MKVKAPGMSQVEQDAVRAGSQMQREAADRAARQDEFFNNTLMPRYLSQMDEQIALGRRQSERQEMLQDYALGLSRKNDARMDAIYSDIEKYDSEDQRELRAGRSIAGVEQELSGQRAAASRGLMRMGVNPNSGAYAAALAGQTTNDALAKVTAANMARTAARQEGLNLRFQAAGLGGGAAGQFLGQAGGLGMSSIGALGSSLGGIQALQGGMGQNAAMWQGTQGFGLGALNGAAGMMANQRQMQFQANQANTNMYNSLINQGAKLGMGAWAGGMSGGGGAGQGMLAVLGGGG